MRVNVDLVLRMRKARAWSQDELATACGLNLRTIQRIEKEATASLQSMKALASALAVSIGDLEMEGSEMIEELVGQDVTIIMAYIGVVDSLKGQIAEIKAPWLKLIRGGKPVYLHMSQIVRVSPQ